MTEFAVGIEEGQVSDYPPRDALSLWIEKEWR
jgi:hypothetical protein